MNITKLKTKRWAISIGLIAAIVLAGLAMLIINKSGETPGYQTVLPYGKSEQELGDWKRISPPNKEPVFAYSDTLRDTPISVSQQPLPERFLDDPDQHVADVAKDFNATSKIDAFGTPVYVGLSAQGPQSVIFTKEGLLIMIKSQEKIPDQAWAEYIQSLVLSKSE